MTTHPAPDTSVDDEVGLSDPDVIQNPYPFYRRLRQHGSVQWHPTLFGGAWLALDFEDVQALFSDSDHLSSRRSEGIVRMIPSDQRERFRTLTESHARWMVFFDPPEHTRIRRVMSRGISTEVRARVEPIVRQHAAALVERIRHAGRVEVVAELAQELPLFTIATLTGIEPDDRHRLIKWSADMAAYVGLDRPDLAIMERAQASIEEFEQYLRRAIAARRRNPLADDMLSILINARPEERPLADDEIIAQCALFAFAGNETTKNLIANTLYCLLTHPDQLRLLQQQPERIDDAIDEALRFECPVQFIGRVVRDDFTYRDAHLSRGDAAIMMVGAANRDARQNPHPDRFDIFRHERGLASFGHGIHGCIGAALARMEARLLIHHFLERCPNPRISDPATVRWRDNPGLRGLQQLHVEFSA